MKGIQNYFKSPFFVSMATAAKFVQSILIFLAYLVPIAVDVVPINFHTIIIIIILPHIFVRSISQRCLDQIL
jgi:hypothetical protein